MIFSALVALTLLTMVYTSISGMLFDRSSASYVDDAVTAIVSNWDAAELEQRAHPQLLQTINQKGGTAKLFEAFRTLGVLKTAPECEGQSYSRYFTTFDRLVTASYACKAEFGTGPAIIKMDLYNDSEKGWLIAGLFVDSKVFKAKAKETK